METHLKNILECIAELEALQQPKSCAKCKAFKLDDEHNDGFGQCFFGIHFPNGNSSSYHKGTDFYCSEFEAKEKEMTRELQRAIQAMAVECDDTYAMANSVQDMIIKCLNIDLDNKEKLLKAKDEEIKELGEIVQQYLIPSKNYDAIIRDKDEEIVKLKLELFRSSPKIANKKARSIVAMLFWGYKKLRYASDGYFHSDEEIENAYYTFKKAYKMLKDNK